MNTFETLTALRNTASSNDKMRILKDNAGNIELKTLLKYAYDKIDYTYGITTNTMLNYSTNDKTSKGMYEILDALNNRDATGHSALRLAKSFYNSADSENKELFCMVLDRDLKIGVNAKTLNKVWKDIVPKPHYCRCGVFSAKTAKKLDYPAYIQLKCDGTYREAYVNNGNVTFKTRAGEESENPVMAEIMKSLPNGYYTGEFTVGKADDPNMNRSEGNGLINSDNPPYNEICFTVWDYLTEDEYTLKAKSNYKTRFDRLNEIVRNTDEILSIVPTKVVNSADEALKIVSEWMNKGLEGGVLKSFFMKFKNGTSNEQLKIKLKVDADLRCTGFIKGTRGTKYENQNKVITFESDDGKVKGQCSGMTDAMVAEVTANPDKYIGKIMVVEFNDLSKAQNSDTYALMHPRFMNFRDDKTETDTLERITELRDMMKNL